MVRHAVYGISIVMKKVAEGIRERQKNKDGTTSYLIEVMFENKRYSKTVRCQSVAQAKRARERFRTEIEDQKVDVGTIRWADLCDLWMEQYAMKQHKKSTIDTELARIEKVKRVWRRQAKKIRRTDVQTWVNDLSNEVSPKTVRNYYSMVSRIFRWAVQKEIVIDSPCQYIDLPKNTKSEARYLDRETFERVVELLPKERLVFQAMVMLGLYAGMRRGEILGLIWDDVNLDTGEYYIQRNRLQGKSGRGAFIDSPKTEKSIRRGTLPQEAVIVLRALKKQQNENQLKLGDKWQGSGYIIAREDGHPIAPPTANEWMRDFVEKNELPYFTLHSLRHTHASLMRYLGANIDEIQKKLGHSEKSTTENIYVHMFESYEKVDREMANKIDHYLERLK